MAGEGLLEEIPLPYGPPERPSLRPFPSLAPPVERVPGKRRRRREAQLEFLLKLGAATEEDDLYHVSHDTKHLIEDESKLRAFLNGANLPPRKAPPQTFRGPPHLREANRGWLRVERKLRTWLRRFRYGLDDVDGLLKQWIAADDDGVPVDVPVVEPMVPGIASRAPILRVPTCVVDKRLVSALGQFYGCKIIQQKDTDFVVLKRPNTHQRLKYGATIHDIL